MKYDVTLIGAGITGCSIAYELSKYDLKVLVLEKENDVAMGTTKANSAIIHAGYDPLPGTKMARLNVLGSKLTKEYASWMNFHYQQIGSLVIGNKERDKKLIDTLYERGIKNGVEGMRILDGREAIEKEGEKNLAPEIDYALLAPSAAICSPWEMALALISNAVVNGVRLITSAPVTKIEKRGDSFFLDTRRGQFESTYVINCAGVDADEVDALVEKPTFHIRPVKGEYYLLDKDQGDLVSHVIFQTPSKLGKGVLVSRTVHNNLIVGPNAEEQDKDKDAQHNETVSNTLHGLAEVRKKAVLSVPSINFFDNVRNFAGARATIPGYDDFLIEESKEVPHFINFAGIKSPGLSSGPAFGLEAVEMLKKDGLEMAEKKEYHRYSLPTFFKELSDEEKEKVIQKDPYYARIICRCESISEGEILASLHMPVPATTIDGVKRRTNAGMGRCQGGFCGPKVFDILRNELHLEYDEVYQDRDGSKVVVSQTKE